VRAELGAERELLMVDVHFFIDHRSLSLLLGVGLSVSSSDDPHRDPLR
jgi:hypothetical protein